MATDTPINTDKVHKFINDIESQKTILSSFTNIFATLTTHFTSLNDSLSQKSKSLDSKLESLESNAQQTLKSLEDRANSIPERESSAISLIEAQKLAALQEFEKPTLKNAGISKTLKAICRKMDSSGLLSFIVSKRKESILIRKEIGSAMAEAVDAPRLVLDAVEEFLDDKLGKVGVTDKRWACGILVQALFPEVKECGKGGPVFAWSVVERAGRIVDKWKAGVGIESGDLSGLGAAEVVIMLHLVVGFGLREKFNQEFLRKVVLEFASRRDMAKLAAGLGLGDKLKDIIGELVKTGKETEQDIIGELVKTGKEIEAVYFASESGLTGQFPPVSLLKAYLRNSKKNATTLLKNGKTDESANLEMNSSRAIIRCVEDHKLESEFSLDSLRKRINQLEKAKAERKKSSGGSKPSKKRANSGSGSRAPPSVRPTKAARSSNAYPTFDHRNPALAAQHSPAAIYSGPYNYPGQSPYEGHTPMPYGSRYSVARTQSPVAVPQHHYPQIVDHISLGGRTSSAYGGQYGAYDYSSAAPSSSYMQ